MLRSVGARGEIPPGHPAFPDVSMKLKFVTHS